MSATQTFHIGDIISVIHDRLVSPDGIDGVYRILGHLTGESPMTHQLPRAAREAEPILRERYLDLAAIVVPDDFDGSRELIDAWLAEVAATHGETREVAPLDPADHTHIDPLTELRMMRPDMPVITVGPTAGEVDEVS